MLAYIGYATVGEIGSAIKVALVIFCVLGAISVVFTVGLDWIFGGAASAAGSWSLALPKWLWGAVVFCGALWFLRGQTIHVPSLTFKEWIFISILITVSGLLDNVLPNWGVALSYGAIMASLYVVEILNENGKKNYERLKEREEISITHASRQ